MTSTEPQATNTLDEIMDRDPLHLSDQDLDTIIAYQRRYRANLEAGGPKAKRITKPKPGAMAIDITALMKSVAPAAASPGSAIKRRL